MTLKTQKTANIKTGGKIYKKSVWIQLRLQHEFNAELTINNLIVILEHNRVMDQDEIHALFEITKSLA